MLKVTGISLAISFGLSVSASPSKAELVRLTVSGTLTGVASELSSVYSVGVGFTGTYIYDNSALPTSQDVSNATYTGVPFNANIVIGGNTFSASAANSLSFVTNASPCCDSFHSIVDTAFSGPSVGAFAPQQSNIYLGSSTGLILSSLGLPPSSTNGALFSTLTFAFLFNDGLNYAGLFGSIQRAEFSPVETPLPATLPLFASALIGGGVVAWRKKRKQQAEALTA